MFFWVGGLRWRPEHFICEPQAGRLDPAWRAEREHHSCQSTFEPLVFLHKSFHNCSSDELSFLSLTASQKKFNWSSSFLALFPDGISQQQNEYIFIHASQNVVQEPPVGLGRKLGIQGLEVKHHHKMK